MDEKSNNKLEEKIVTSRIGLPLLNQKDEKLYIVTHSELSVGCQTVQVAHAVANFVLTYPVEAAKWSSVSNVIVILEVENVEKLTLLYYDAKNRELEVCAFREMDLCNEITAIAFKPSTKARKFVRELPLAGNNVKLLQQQQFMDREKKLFMLSQRMIMCKQSPTQNILQHGSSVCDHYFLLVAHLRGIITLRNPLSWKLPSWLEENRQHILSQLPSAFVMDRYLTLHDCGKPNVFELDTKGNPHFPNHAAASEMVYHELVENQEPTIQNEQIKYLIAHDMDLHTVNVKPDDPFFTSGLAIAQILAGLAEITSNAAMFGGIASTSFKIKFGRIEKRGKMYFSMLAQTK